MLKYTQGSDNMSKVDISRKKRSQIIIDIIKNNIDVAQALEILDLLLENINDQKIKKWVNAEINGYNSDEELPKYRIVPANLSGTIKTYTTIISNYHIPISPEEENKLNKHSVRSGINQIMQMAKAESESKTHALSIPVNIIYINSIACINGEVTHAELNLNLYAYTNILGSLKNKILSILKELEKQYGNLDDYYIDFENDSKEKKVVNNITNIIFDRSIKIGDGNDISKSIVGDDNEH